MNTVRRYKSSVVRILAIITCKIARNNLGLKKTVTAKKPYSTAQKKPIKIQSQNHPWSRYNLECLGVTPIINSSAHTFPFTGCVCCVVLVVMWLVHLSSPLSREPGGWCEAQVPKTCPAFQMGPELCAATAAQGISNTSFIAGLDKATEQLIASSSCSNSCMCLT